MAFHFSKRKLRPKEEEETGELNIVPYLDIMMNLIMFMLLSMTGLVAFVVVNVAAPRYNTGGVSSGGGDEANKPKLLLTVLVSERGFYVAGAGGVLGAETPAEGEQPTDPSARPPTLPRLPSGDYDYAGLTAKMVQIKQAFPDETKIILGADAKIPYEILVKTMDACREHQGNMLFVDVSLTVM